MTDMTADELRKEARNLNRLAIIAEREEVLARIAEREALRPKEPDLLGGAKVITFTRYASGRIYSYAAVGWRMDRRQTRWAITASLRPAETGDTHGRYTWSGLLDFIGDANWKSIALVTAVEYLVKDEPSVVEKMGRYGSVNATEPVEPWHGKGGPFGGNRDVDGSGQYGL